MEDDFFAKTGEEERRDVFQSICSHPSCSSCEQTRDSNKRERNELSSIKTKQQIITIEEEEKKFFPVSDFQSNNLSSPFPMDTNEYNMKRESNFSQKTGDASPSNTPNPHQFLPVSPKECQRDIQSYLLGIEHINDFSSAVLSADFPNLSPNPNVLPTTNSLGSSRNFASSNDLNAFQFSPQLPQFYQFSPHLPTNPVTPTNPSMPHNPPHSLQNRLSPPNIRNLETSYIFFF